MSWNETMSKALAQARELHRQTLEAANKAAEDMKPQMQEAVNRARELQSIFNKHATESSATMAEHAKNASQHLNDRITRG